MATSIRKKLMAIWHALELPTESEPLSRGRMLILIGVIFLLASLVRYVHHLDLAPLVSTGRQDFAGTTAIHDGVASDILNKGIEAIFPSKWPQLSDTSLIQYPPGYALLLSAVYYINGRDPSAVQLVQALLDSVAAVLLFLIALELFNHAVAFVAGLAAAISHHLAYYSVLLLPDGVASVFILAGTLLLIRGLKVGWDKNRGYRELAGAGLFYGLSCWLRASAMLLWIFWAITFLLLRKQIVKPIQRALTVALVMFVAIAPLTIRNYYIYKEVIPISLGSGVLLQAGLGEADPSLGFPFKDDDTMRWEAKLYHQPDYMLGLMTPDGIFREKERARRSVKVILDRPFWYIGVMAGRVNLMMKYSAHAPLIRKELPADRSLANSLSAYQAQHGSLGGLLRYYIDYGSAIDYLRPLLYILQRGFKESALLLIVIGALIGLKDRRRWLILMTVPFYFLLLHSVMHAEFRYVLPAHYLLFIFYAIAFHAVFVALPKSLRDKFRLPVYANRIGLEPFEQLKASHPALRLADEQTRGAVTASTIPVSTGEIIRDRKIIAGVGIDSLTQNETIGLIDSFIAARVPRMMAVVNASKIVLAQEDDELKRILIGADIVTADGMSVVWASRFLGRPLKERVTGIDTFEQVIALAARKNYPVYLLGAKQEVVEAVAGHFQKRYTSLKIAGYHNGYFGRSEDVIADIQRAAPDILCVAMGSPRQEKWLAANLHTLKIPFAIGVGGSFDHVAGFVRRAPLWMQKLGLEWFYRLLREPRRLWRRYLIGNTLFVMLVLRECGKGKKDKREKG